MKKTKSLPLTCISDEQTKYVWSMYKCDDFINFVYLFISADSEVLYVGKTGDFEKRWGEHCRSNKDMDKVAYVEVMIYATPRGGVC